MSEPLRVTKGQPDDEELAAVVIALDVVAASAAANASPLAASRWRHSLGAPSLNAMRGVRREWRSR